jgi:hypothetical protein
MTPDTRQDVITDARFELRLRQWAPPIVLLLTYFAFSVPSLAAGGRILFSMWLHELGHTVSAWLCGFAALPGPWRTRIPDGRSWWVLAMVLLVIAWATWRRWRSAELDDRPRQQRLTLGLGAAAALLVVWLWRLPEDRASQFILFAGDGGGMVLGVALVACFYVRQDRYLHHTGLRWGFLVIGAAGFLDPARVWLRASDHDTIAFGHIEGVGDSDPTRLVDVHDWPIATMVDRFQTLVWLGFAALLFFYARGLWAGRRQVADEALAAEAAQAEAAHRFAPGRGRRPTAGAGGGTTANR